ncbi:multifunctional transcriptional regulator/nicotinamide-nucleotide adenylyltransferase/ribosylnicotinamide kinase NadR [Pradoshia sp.]
MNNGPSIESYKNKVVGYYGGKFLPFHNGHLNCIIEAASMVDVLFVVISYDDDYDQSLCEGTKFKWVPSSTRERWVTEAVRELRNIRVLTKYERRMDDYLNNDDIRKANEQLLAAIGGKVDYVFSSEEGYDDYFACYYPSSKHIVIDPKREYVDISATRIREKGIYESWEYLPKPVKKDYTKRVCLCGIESVGKSFLTKQLAALYDTQYVNEYGRDFYEEIGGCFDIVRQSDFIKIAMGHNYLIEQKIKEANKVLFIDTDNIYTQFFHQQMLGKENETISAIINSGVDEIDLYIYIEPSLPHELDGFRQEKTLDDKERENKMLKNLYRQYGKNLKIVKSIKDIKEIKNLIDDLFNT